MPTLELHTLILGDTKPEETLSKIRKIMLLSNDIFSHEAGSKYTALDLWTERFSHPSSSIIYLSSEDKDNEFAGFLFAHPRTHSTPLLNGESESLHIWLAGVSPARRRGGCLQRMVEAIPTGPSRTLTICTSPSMFPNMWQWLLKRYWTVERELGGGKVLLSKPIPLAEL